MTRSRGILAPRRYWSGSDIRVLRDLYPDLLAETVAQQLGRPVTAVYAKAKALGLAKSAEFNASDMAGRIQQGSQSAPMIATRFQKGLTPWNKGLKGLQFEGSKATQFKPGTAPHNWRPVGSYRVVYGNLERKVNELSGSNSVRWHPVHRIVWEAAHGPVPTGWICVFKPGRHTAVLEEVTLDRLGLVTRAENLRRNHPRARSPELGRLVQLKGAIARQVNLIEKAAREREEEHA